MHGDNARSELKSTSAQMRDGNSERHQTASCGQRSCLYATTPATGWHNCAILTHHVERYALVIIRLGHNCLKIPRIVVYQGLESVNQWLSLATGA